MKKILAHAFWVTPVRIAILIMVISLAQVPGDLGKVCTLLFP